MTSAIPNGRPSFRECHQAAGRIKAGALHRRVIATVRPRGVAGHVRQQLPLAGLLYFAGVQGRLVWRSVDQFALLDPPESARSNFRTPKGWYLLNRYWDPLLTWIVVIPLMVVWIVITLVPSTAEYAILGELTVIGYTALVMIAAMVRGIGWLVRRLDARVRDRGELVGDLIIAQNWFMPLCHVADPDGGEQTIRDALLRVRNLGGSAGAIYCAEAGITSPATLAAIERSHLSTRVTPAGRFGLLVLGGLESTRRAAGQQAADPHVPIGGLTALLVSSLVVVAIQADTVAEAERSACGAGPCASRPTSYLDAFFWLLQRLSVVVRVDSLTVDAPVSKITGLADAGLGLVLYACVAMAGWRFMRSRVNALTVIANQRERSRLLILTATRLERDAVLHSARRIVEQVAYREFFPGHTVFWLGAIKRTEILLAQCDPTSAGPSGSTLTAAELIDLLTPDYLVLTGVCQGLRETEQDLGDILISRQLLELDPRKVVDVPGGTRVIQRGDRVRCSPTLLDRFLSADLDWVDSRVHFGLMLSTNVEVSSWAFKRQLLDADPEAVGCEMEGAGVYGAAARNKVDWIVARSIAGWATGAVDKTATLAAARNAAEYVMHVVAAGALDLPPLGFEPDQHDSSKGAWTRS